VSLTGAVKPTFLYPRIKFGSPAVTIDAAEPTSRIPTTVPYTGLRGSNTVASGKTEYLFGRDEEQVGIALRCEQDQLAALRWFVQDFAKFGSQFQAWVDRNTGSCWPFENNLKDQNGLAMTLTGITAAYTAGVVGTAISLAGAYSLSVPLAQASAATLTGFDDPLSAAEGVLVVDVSPAFASSDGVLHHFLATSGTANRFFLSKNASNALIFQINDATDTAKATSGAVTWSTGQRVVIVASWNPSGTLRLWYSTTPGTFTELTTSTGAGTGLMSALPTTLFVGSDATPANRAAGTYDTLSFFKSTYGGLTDRAVQGLAGYRVVERTYFPYAELLAAQFQPARVVLGRPIWDWPMMFKNGVPA
jgi:hypothetical protein